jgi:hypothetical protein
MGDMEDREDIFKIKDLPSAISAISSLKGISHKSAEKFIRKNLCKLKNTVTKDSLRNLSKKSLLSNKTAKEIIQVINQHFLSIKQDPQFISLDQAFTTSPSEDNYKNLITYLSRDWENFKSMLINEFNINEDLYNLNNYAMDDNFLPLYNYNNHHNTWAKYTTGEIEFNYKNEYAVAYQAMKSGYEFKFEKNKQLIVFSKLGVGVGYTFITNLAFRILDVLIQLLLLL